MSALHATAVAWRGWAALLVGPPGAGKSDLALRAIDRGWRLVADDGVLLAREGARLVARAPAAIAGLIEVRGLGIARIAHVAAPVARVVDLAGAPARMPARGFVRLRGIAVERVALDPWEGSAAIKLELAFTRALRRLEEGSR